MKKRCVSFEGREQRLFTRATFTIQGVSLMYGGF